MNKTHLENETYSEYVKRLEHEMEVELVEHKMCIAQALREAGHKVAEPEDLTREGLAETWVVDGDETVMRGVVMRESFYPCRPTGSIRFEVGPYGDYRRKFSKRTAVGALKKFPQGFDYKAIAEEMVDAIQAEKNRIAKYDNATQISRQNDAKAYAAARRLESRFGLSSPLYSGGMSTPLGHDSGQENLKLNFTHLTEDQARAIMSAARDCGASPWNTEE